MSRLPDKPTLNVKEVAQLVGKTERSIQGHIARGTFEIPHFRVGGSIRFWREKVEAWIEKTQRSEQKAKARKG